MPASAADPSSRGSMERRSPIRRELEVPRHVKASQAAHEPPIVSHQDPTISGTRPREAKPTTFAPANPVLDDGVRTVAEGQFPGELFPPTHRREDGPDQSPLAAHQPLANPSGRAR